MRFIDDEQSRALSLEDTPIDLTTTGNDMTLIKVAQTVKPISAADVEVSIVNPPVREQTLQLTNDFPDTKIVKETTAPIVEGVGVPQLSKKKKPWLIIAAFVAAVIAGITLLLKSKK
jgi:hypothetical protein